MKAEEIWGYVDVTRSTNDCWLWTKETSINGCGHAMVGFEGKRWYVHRLIYTWLVGPIPEGYVLDHKCHIKLCCNPLHLEPVTTEENSRRTAQVKRRETVIRFVCEHCHQALTRTGVRSHYCLEDK